MNRHNIQPKIPLALISRIQMSKKWMNCADGLASNVLDGFSAIFGQTIPKLAQLIASEMRFKLIKIIQILLSDF